MTRTSVTRSLVVLHFQAGRQVCSCGCGGTMVPHPTKTSSRARFLHGHNGRTALPERFWSKVAKAGPDDCWLWTAGVGAHGYGQFSLGGTRTTAQRVAYELAVGPIAAGLHIDHLCANKLCANPAHLEPVSSGENTRRHYRKQTHCKHGHALTLDNLYVRASGRTECLTCVKARNKAAWQRTKAAKSS